MANFAKALPHHNCNNVQMLHEETDGLVTMVAICYQLSYHKSGHLITFWNKTTDTYRMLVME